MEVGSHTTSHPDLRALAFTWSGGRLRPTAAPRLPAPVRAGGARLVTKLAGVRVPNRLYTMVRPTV